MKGSFDLQDLKCTFLCLEKDGLLRRRRRDITEIGSDSDSSSAESSSAGEEELSGLESDAEDLAGDWDDADEATCAAVH